MNCEHRQRVVGLGLDERTAAAVDAAGLDWLKILDAVSKFGPVVLEILKSILTSNTLPPAAA